MNILVLEASGNEVALAAIEIEDDIFRSSRTDFRPDDAKVRVVWSSDDVRSLSRELTRQIDEILRSARWKMSDVNAIAVGLGPGSWTSLRVVLATCKTLAQARDWNIVGVPSFDGIARAAWNSCLVKSSTRSDETRIVVASNSRADEIYCKIFRVRDEFWQVEQGERVLKPHDLRAEMSAFSRVLVSGEAANELAHGANQKFDAVFVSVEETTLHLGLLAMQRLARHESDDALTLQPLYVALSAAERNLAQREANKHSANVA